MQNKKEYIKDLAAFLYDNKKVMSAGELAEHLNRNNFTTIAGTKFEGGMGTFKLISSVYKWASETYGADAAEKVARAFVTSKGDYAYEQ